MLQPRRASLLLLLLLRLGNRFEVRGRFTRNLAKRRAHERALNSLGFDLLPSLSSPTTRKKKEKQAYLIQRHHRRHRHCEIHDFAIPVAATQLCLKPQREERTGCSEPSSRARGRPTSREGRGEQSTFLGRSRAFRSRCRWSLRRPRGLRGSPAYESLSC